MSAVFLKVLNMSITASWLILAVVLTRLILKKAPKWIPCLLWGLVAIRLICPFSFESVLSLIPSSETIPANIAQQHEPAITSGITIVNEVVNPVISESFTPAPTNSANPLQIVIPVAAIVWIAGIIIMLAYALISYIKLKKTLSVCVPVGERILACDEVKAPFILGVFKPVIYVPSSMNGKTLEHVIRHEKAHLQRHDHWWKPLGFLLLAVYWFNPLCWIAYILLCRDIEMACDEKVIRNMDKDDMAAYSQALLDCSFPRKQIAACPLAFGEVGVKERVKGVLNYKKPAFWIILIAIIACIVLAVCLMTDPFSNKSLSGKLGVSMDMAVAGHNHSSKTEGRFVALDYDVLQVSKTANRTTVYAWVMYEEYSFDGTDVKEESGSHIPTVITFDTSSEDSDKSTYDVIEYWEPRDGSYFPEDIRSKFPLSIRAKAFDVSGADQQHENCLRAAREYFGVDQNKLLEAIFEQYYTIQEITYEDKRDGGTSTLPLPEYYLSINKELLILEDLNSSNWLNAGLFMETELSKDTFDNYYPSSWRNSAANLRQNNAKAWQLIVSDLPDSLFYYLLLQKDGEVYLTRGYYDATEKGDPDSDDTRITYVFLLKKNDTHSETEIDMESLRAKYPEYFDLGTFKGLELYVWQMAPDSYSCGLMLGTNRNKTLEELMNLKGASIAEMRAILSTYDIDEKDVFIIPWQNPVSSYIAEYWISQKDEDPASVERRKQEYIDGICQMLFGDAKTGVHDLKSPIVEIKTAVAYANWTEGEMMHDCLNPDKMLISSVRHLPVYKLDTKEDLDRFKEKYQDSLTFDHGYDEVPSFNEATASYDESFFADRTLVLAYVSAPSGSFRYAIRDISFGGSTFCLDVVQTNNPETHTDDMAGWLVIAEVLDSDIANYTEFDAQLVNIRTDVCELYLEVLEDLWTVDPGLNDGISQIGIDLSELSHLTELEKETVMHEFASKHNLPFIAGTWEELCEQGYIDKDNLYWEDGLFFSIKTNEDAEWNLPAAKDDDSVPELTAFDAQKWRSGLGAYFFGQCTAQKNADGKWSYTVGQEAIS